MIILFKNLFLNEKEEVRKKRLLEKDKTRRIQTPTVRTVLQRGDHWSPADGEG